MHRTIGVRSTLTDSWIRRFEDIEKEGERSLGISTPLVSRIIIAPMTADSRLGFFRADDPAIVISESLVRSAGERDIMNVFLHELAHALDYRMNGEAGHGPSFRECCRRLGLDAGFDKSHIRLEIGSKERRSEKIRKLLSLSSSPFENESAIAIQKAQELMMENGVEARSDERIYETVLLSSSRFSYGIKEVLSYTERTSGIFLLYVPSPEGRSAMAYGSLGEVEFAIYLLDYLISSSQRAIRTLRKAGKRITKDSFLKGAIDVLSERTREENIDNAIITLRTENEKATRTIVYPETRLVRRSIRSSSLFDRSSYDSGKGFGNTLDISKSKRRKLIEKD